MQGISNICILSKTTQTPFITNCLVTIVHTKPVNNNFSPKLVAMATTLWHSISAMSSSDSLTRKTHPYRIKLRVASYHTTKVIAHRTPKPVIANCVQKLVAMATSLSTYRLPSNTWFLRPIRAHNPNGIPIGSAVFAQTTVEHPYTLQWDAHSPQKNLPLPMGDLDPV